MKKTSSDLVSLIWKIQLASKEQLEEWEGYSKVLEKEVKKRKEILENEKKQAKNEI